MQIKTEELGAVRATLAGTAKELDHVQNALTDAEAKIPMFEELSVARTTLALNSKELEQLKDALEAAQVDC